MKLNGALKPRQGASIHGSSTGVVLKKYRDKRYYKLNKNVVYGRLSPYKCDSSLTGKKQLIIKNSQYIYRQKQIQLQQTPIQKQQDNACNIICKSSDCNNSNNNNIISLSGEIQNKSTVTVTKRSFCFIDFTENRGTEYSNIKAAILAKEKKQKNKNKNNITARQVKNNKSESNKNKNEKARKQTKKIQVVKTTNKLLNQHVNVNHNKTNNKNNNINNNSDLIYSIEEQQQQQEEQSVVNKFLSIVKIYENLILCALIISAAIISRFFLQLKLLLFLMYSHAIKHLDGCYPIDRLGRNGGIGNHNRRSVHSSTVSSCKNIVITYGFILAKIMRASQSLKEPFEFITFKNVNKSHLNSSIALWLVVCAAVTILLPQPVVGDDGDNFFPINSIETTTPEFDYASRGQKKFGDKCDNTLECGFPGSICDPKKKSCQCTEDLPVTNHIDKCGKEAAVNESCFFNEQCEVKYFQTECRDQRCVCRFDMTPVWLKDGTVECKGRGDKRGPETYIDPAMIGVLIGMALMFIIICVVLRLFSQARWRENRTIFNTPNPRLMNVSLLRESKLLHGQERRGSRMSVRVPSRQPSMASLRPHSPNPSLGKTGSRSNSHGSNASATSLRSTRSNSVSPAGITVNNTHHERKGSTYQPHHHHHHQTSQAAIQQQLPEQEPLTQTNIISNPVAETVTVEIIEPEK